MSAQNYKNHIRFYIPHHFILLPALLVLMGVSIFSWHDYRFAIVFFCIFYLAIMLRQHYALMLQNRLVILEVQFRYFTLTGKRLEDVAPNLTHPQYFALRFAPDAELPAQVQKAAENTPAKELKKSIVNWRADNMRV